MSSLSCNVSSKVCRRHDSVRCIPRADRIRDTSFLDRGGAIKDSENELYVSRGIIT